MVKWLHVPDRAAIYLVLNTSIASIHLVFRRIVLIGSAFWILATLCALGLLYPWIPASGAAGYGAAFTPSPFVEPEGCQEPPGDYARVWVNGAELNGRTLAMLDHAQALYQAQGGNLDFRQGITQGSYTGGALAASFGTHDSGGALDLSVLNPRDGTVLWDEIEPMIRALRVAGFAAWLRDVDDLYPGSPIHIHAIAIGDQELSEAARAQLDGTFGYLRGFDGLPRRNGIPVTDRHGGPLICGWMIARGYPDLRGKWNPLPTPGGTSVAVTDLP